MHIPNTSCLNIWENIKTIQKSLELGDQPFANLMGLSCDEYQLLKEDESSLKLDIIDTFCKKINISLYHLLNGQFDLEIIRNYYYGQEETFPSQYTQMANGNLRTFTALLDYVEVTRGIRFRNIMLRKFQLTESMLMTPNKPVSINLYEDFTTELSKSGIQDEEFFRVGFLANRENLKCFRFDELITRYQNESPTKKSILIMLDLLDTNHNYKIEKFKRNFCYLSSYPREEITDFFHKSKIGNKQTCLIKQGAFSSISRCLGDHHGFRVRKIKCIHQGDKHCLYKILFPLA